MLRHTTNQKVGQRDKYEHKRKDLFECKDKENANIKNAKTKYKPNQTEIGNSIPKYNYKIQRCSPA